MENSDLLCIVYVSSVSLMLVNGWFVFFFIKEVDVLKGSLVLCQ